MGLLVQWGNQLQIQAVAGGLYHSLVRCRSPDRQDQEMVPPHTVLRHRPGPKGPNSREHLVAV